MGDDVIPTVAENVETTETQSMEANAPENTDNFVDTTSETQTTMQNPLSETSESEPKNLTDVMYNSIGEKTPEPVDNRTDFEKSIPEEFKEKAFVKKYSSIDGLLKAHESALNKLGERPEEIDFANATDEQLNKFYERMRPEDISSYEFPEAATDVEKEGIGKIFHDAGLHPHQAKQVIEKYNEFVINAHQQEFSQESFEKYMMASVGENYNAKLPEIQKTIAQTMGNEVNGFIEKLPSNLKAAFYGFANKFNESYGAGEMSVNSNVSDMGSVDWGKRASDAMNALRALESNPNHTEADKQQLVAQYKEAKINQSKVKGR